jgi:transposase
MRQKSETRVTPEQIVKNIRRATRKHHSTEEKIRIVLEGLRGEYSIAEFVSVREGEYQRAISPGRSSRH